MSEKPDELGVNDEAEVEQLGTVATNKTTTTPTHTKLSAATNGLDGTMSAQSVTSRQSAGSPDYL